MLHLTGLIDEVYCNVLTLLIAGLIGPMRRDTSKPLLQVLDLLQLSGLVTNLRCNGTLTE